jgi:putative Mn2+ efflux pump MntP
MGVLLLAFSASSSLWVTAALMVLIGGAQAIRQSMSNVLIHTYVDDEYRGRVASVLSMEVGLVSLSSFGVGLAAATFGVQYALAATSLGLIAFVAAMILFVPRYRALD